MADTIVRIAPDETVVVLFGADLLAPLVTRATDAATRAETGAAYVAGAIPAFDANAASKTTAFDTNAASKQGAYDTNAATKLTTYNDNAAAKVSAYDANASNKTTTFNDNATAANVTIDGKAAAAAASAASAASPLVTLGHDILGDGAAHMQFISQNSFAVQSGDGTYVGVGSAGGGMSRDYSIAAGGDLVPLGYMSLSAKFKTGGPATGSPIKLTFFAGATAKPANNVGAADAFGQLDTGPILIPADATSVRLNVPTTANGDRVYLQMVPARSAQAAKAFADKSTVAIVPEPIVGPSAVRTVIRNGTAQTIIDMNGTAASFERALLIRGITPNAATLNALAIVEEDLYRTGWINDLVYLNLYCGFDSPIAARTPFLSRGPLRMDRAPASFTTFVESSGLQTGVQLGTGIHPNAHGIGRYGQLFGVYGLSDQVTDTSVGVIGDGSALQLIPRFANITLFDRGGGGGVGRVQTTAATGSKGLLAGMSDGAGIGVISLNGIERVTSVGAGPAAMVKNQVVVNTANLNIAASVIGRNNRRSDPAALFYMIHDFQKALGRAVTGEGLY